MVYYTYDAWGNILNTTGTLASTLGQLNPLRYRGYVYDQETGLYYLQSRYYNPTTARFLNADTFASTGQGILGNNMFAYCLNNPVNGCDPHGDVFLPVLTLADYYLIHQMVQMRIVGSEGYAMEVSIISPVHGRGRLDLFDAANNEYYEVKHEPLSGAWNNSIQKQKYDTCTITALIFWGYHFDSSPTAGDRLDISGQFQYLHWDVTYESVGNGLITYLPRLNKKRFLKSLQVAAGVVGSVAGIAVGYASSIAKGGTSKYVYKKIE